MARDGYIGSIEESIDAPIQLKPGRFATATDPEGIAENPSPVFRQGIRGMVLGFAIGMVVGAIGAGSLFAVAPIFLSALAGAAALGAAFTATSAVLYETPVGKIFGVSKENADYTPILFSARKYDPISPDKIDYRPQRQAQTTATRTNSERAFQQIIQEERESGGSQQPTR
ncbi:MAG: hypothetical protein KAH34_19230 [Ketobacter sp.]|nr:hypothetical protein [Ketobacter sp.]